MIRTTLGIFGAVTIVALAASFGNVSAETAKAPKTPAPPACNTLKEEFACKGRDDCQWVAAVVDAKTNKEKRKAYCRRVPKAKAKPK